MKWPWQRRPAAPEIRTRLVVKPIAMTMPADKRDFELAEQGRLVSGWTSNAAYINTLLEQHLRVMKARSREQGLNNPYAVKFVELLKANVVGPQGVRLQVQARRGKGNTGGLDQSANDAIEDGWKDWASNPVNCDVAEQLTWKDLQELAIQTVAEDGEAIFRIVQGGEPGGRYGTRLQVIDTDRLDYTYKDDLANGNRIRMGIEYTPWGAPVAYWIAKASPEFSVAYSSRSTERERVPAEQIIHLYRTRRSEQRRGLPWLHASLWHLRQLHGWLQAGVVAARVGAAKMGFIATDDEIEGDAVPSETGESRFDAEPGVIDRLPAGAKVESWNPEYPKGETKEFIKALMLGISAGANVAYHALANDLEGVNYSSIRAGVMEDRETWKGLQGWFIEHFVARVYQAWLPMAILSIALHRPSGKELLLEGLDRYKAVRYQGRRWAWVDPQSDGAANRLAIEDKVRSRSSVIRELGEDPDEVWREIAEENQQLEALGLVPKATKPEPPAKEEPAASDGKEKPADDSADDEDVKPQDDAEPRSQARTIVEKPEEIERLIEEELTTQLAGEEVEEAAEDCELEDGLTADEDLDEIKSAEQAAADTAAALMERNLSVRHTYFGTEYVSADREDELLDEVHALKCAATALHVRLDAAAARSKKQRRKIEAQLRAFQVNERARIYAEGRIEKGFKDATTAWSISQDELAALNENPGRYFLSRSLDADRFEHPTGKFVAGEFTVFASALETIIKQAAEADVIEAAERLLGLIDGGPAEVAEDAQPGADTQEPAGAAESDDGDDGGGKPNQTQPDGGGGP